MTDDEFMKRVEPLLDVPFKFWTCCEKATITWIGDIAVCHQCGMTNKQMLQWKRIPEDWSILVGNVYLVYFKADKAFSHIHVCRFKSKTLAVAFGQIIYKREHEMLLYRPMPPNPTHLLEKFNETSGSLCSD